jgi:hypothetical protein
MIKKYITIIIICFVFLQIGNLHAEVIDEKTFYDLGYDNFTILKDQNVCKEIIIKNLDSSLNSKTVLQLEIENYIFASNGLQIDIYLNSLKEKELKNTEIIKKNIIKLHNFKKNQDNNLTICINNSFLPKIVFSKQSVIGNYLLAEILESNFKQIIPPVVESNSLVPIELVVENTGYAPIYIELSNANDKYLNNIELENVSGQTEYKGIINSKDFVNIKYFIKTNKNTKFISPKATLKYTDEFGTNYEINSKLEVIETIDKLSKLEAYINIPRNIINKEEVSGKIILKNNSEEYITEIFIEPNTNLFFELNINKLIKLNPKDIIEVPFTIKSYNIGNYKMNFNITYEVANNSEKYKLTTDVINIESETKKDFLSEIIGSLILIFIIIYIWAFKF